MHRLPLRALPPTPGVSLPTLLLIVGLGVLALLLRGLAAASHSTIPASDELGYLGDGLLLLEGLAPGYKHVPNAPIDWLVMLAAGLQTAGGWLFGPADGPGVAAILRPLLAMERALFANYADLDFLRGLVLGLQVTVGAAAAAATAWRGWQVGGMPGAVLGGTLAAATPLFVEFAGEARAYSLAWSLGLLAFAILPDGRPHFRRVASGLLIGLAVATRVEMALVLVPLLLELAGREAAQHDEGGHWLRGVGQCLGIAVVTFLVAAPWYVTSLAGNLRQIISVRLLTPPDDGGSLAGTIGALALDGMAAPIVVAIAGLLLKRDDFFFSRRPGSRSTAAPEPGRRRDSTESHRAIAPRGAERWAERRFSIAIGLWIAALAALALRPSIHGLRHDGALLVLVAALAPTAIGALAQRLQMPRLAMILAALLGLHVAVSGSLAARTVWRAAVEGDPVAWLEQHVPAGSTVYWVEGFKVPLPTAAASDRLWAETARPEAWRIKYRTAAQRLSLGDGPPRAMSEDPLQLERAQRRRWFILGAPVDTMRPRYDIHLVAKFGPFARTVHEVLDALCANGGTYVYTGWPEDRLGEPRMRWRPADPLRNSIVLYTIEPPKPGEGKRC